MDIVLRASVMFFVLYGVLRLLGKHELGQMTPFELVVLIVMGDLIQQGVTHSDYSLTGAILAVASFAFWGLMLSWVTYLWPSAERALDGSPRVLVRDGHILEDALKRDRMTYSELTSEMRMAGIAHVEDVAWAILEPQGKISFIARQPQGQRNPNSQAQPLA